MTWHWIVTVQVAEPRGYRLATAAGILPAGIATRSAAFPEILSIARTTLGIGSDTQVTVQFFDLAPEHLEQLAGSEG